MAAATNGTLSTMADKTPITATIKVWLGKASDKKYKSVARGAIYTLVTVFSVSSVLVYYIVGMP